MSLDDFLDKLEQEEQELADQVRPDLCFPVELEFNVESFVNPPELKSPDYDCDDLNYCPFCGHSYDD
jgi:hypothetical protein